MNGPTTMRKPATGHAGGRPKFPMPAVPETMGATGLAAEAIEDLVVKALYVQGAKTGREITDVVCLPFEMVDDRLMHLQHRREVEVTSTTGPNRGSYRFNLTDAGRGRARDALASSQYVGPAPVPLAQYEEWIKKQSLRNVHITRHQVEHGFDDLVLDPELFKILGPAINSARSLFLYGEPGNGKTTIAEAIARLIGGDVFIPHAVDISGQTMVLFDPSHHVRVSVEEGQAEGPDWLRDLPGYDRRWVRIKRPVVMAGGELTLEQLDLQFDHHTKLYQAPFQLKAAGGVLIIDDFGRQRVPANELLNRWIVPLEKQFDFLTLHTGVKFRVPFDSLLIFATNLEPADLVDEAFLRRIQYKINVGSPDRKAYTEIFRKVCEARGVTYLDSAIDYVFRTYYDGAGIEPRGCHPRDIIDHLQDIAKYEDRPPVPTDDILDEACSTYFLIMAAEAMGNVMTKSKQAHGGN